MAALAVSGCVTVQAGPAPAQPPHTARPSQVVQPQVVQGPAREVLEAPPEPKAASRPAKAAPGPHAKAPAPAPRRTWRERERERATPQRQRPRPHRPPAARPPTPPAAPASRPDLCALGEQYGRWRPSSQEARICRETYGG
ncbi:hypothetical protein AB0M39_37925 [Streptomyces sp. NPDC051907]|uniref:hypothetical protein n=1 Tax=Streptomyces sp. NPDC051907 TaxID=3155284 RepID=UPI00344A8140